MKKKKLWIYTSAYRPFIMGGDVNAPISIQVEVGASIPVGRGLRVYRIQSPDGDEHFVDLATGGIVGQSLTQIRADVLEADPEFLKKQLKDEKERCKKAVPVSAEEFWRLLA